MIAPQKEAPGGQQDEIVELRVHGVGGSSPAGLLAHKNSERFGQAYKIAGDDITGFYRANWEKERHRKLEGYLWGGLTSRKASRALWLLLLPFALANIAGWMIEPRAPKPPHPTEPTKKPETGDLDFLARVQIGLVRLFSAGTTVLFMTWIGALVVDLVAYQCGGQDACTKGRFWMTPFTGNLISEFPARRALVGVGVLLLIVMLLAFLSFRAQNRYERTTFGEDKSWLGRDGSGLAYGEFWASSEFVRRLTHLHMALAVTTVAGLYSLGLDVAGKSSKTLTLSWPTWTMVGVAALLLIVIVIAGGMRNPDKDDKPEPQRERGETWVDWVFRHPIVFWLLLVGFTGYIFWLGWSGTKTETAYGAGIEPVWGRALLYTAAVLLIVVLLMFGVRFLTWWNRPLKHWAVALAATAFWAFALGLTAFWSQLDVERLDLRLVVGVGAVLIAAVIWFMGGRRLLKVVVPVLVLAAVALAAVLLDWTASWTHVPWPDSRVVVGILVAIVAWLSWITCRHDNWKAVVALLLIATTTLMWLGGTADHWIFWVLVGIAAAAALFALLRADHLVLRILVGLAAIAAVIVAWRVDYFGENFAIQWLALGLIGLGLLPGLGAEFGRKDTWRWGGPLPAVGLSLVLIAVTAAGSIVALVDFLDRGEATNCCETPVVPTIEYLSAYQVVALVLLGAAAMAVVGAILHYFRVRLDLWGPQAEAIAADYRSAEPDDKRPGDHQDCLTEDGGKVVKSAIGGRSLGSAARDADVVLTSLVATALTIVVIALIRIALREVPESDWADWTRFIAAIETPPVSDDWRPLVRLAVTGAAALPLAAVALIRSAQTDEDKRKSIGTVWDVLTFWPRRFHPLAPPSYAERAVPELATRVRQLSRDGSKVMLVAHSQGAVVTASAVALLDGTGDLRPYRTYVVTHGNPLGRLYRRAFPGYWGGGFLRYLESRLGTGGSGWLNLHRLTDPIGDQIFTGPDERLAGPGEGPLNSGDYLLPDPASRWRFDLDPCASAAGHSNYLKQRRAIEKLDELAQRLEVVPAAATRLVASGREDQVGGGDLATDVMFDSRLGDPAGRDAALLEDQQFIVRDAVSRAFEAVMADLPDDALADLEESDRLELLADLVNEELSSEANTQRLEELGIGGIEKVVLRRLLADE